MKTFTLVETSRFVDPVFFNRMRGGGHVQAVVGDDGRVMIDHVELEFRDPKETLPPGTAIQVWLVRDYVCVSEAELAAYNVQREAERKRQDEEYRARLNRYRVEAEAINAGIKLPVGWTVAIKDVLSGLSERSNGDGRSKSTVNHIYLKEDFEFGRIKRKSTDLLCTSPSGTNGKRWAQQSEEAACFDGDGNRYTPPVTCKQCLKIVENVMSQTASKEAAQGLSVTGYPNRPVSASMQKTLFKSFLEKGDSFHSGRGETAWVIMDHCERNRIPYRVEVARFNGSAAGVRIARADRDLPSMKEVELPGDAWQPVSESLKDDPLFSAIGRDGEGNEFRFWNGGGDWLRDASREAGFAEELCSPVEWKGIYIVVSRDVFGISAAGRHDRNIS